MGRSGLTVVQTTNGPARNRQMAETSERFPRGSEPSHLLGRKGPAWSLSGAPTAGTGRSKPRGRKSSCEQDVSGRSAEEPQQGRMDLRGHGGLGKVLGRKVLWRCGEPWTANRFRAPSWRSETGHASSRSRQKFERGWQGRRRHRHGASQWAALEL